MSSLKRKKNRELERAYYELEFLGRDCGGLSWLTEWRTKQPLRQNSRKIDHQFEGSIDSANRSEDAPSFMKVE
jgi:hypothetical protein